MYPFYIPCTKATELVEKRAIVGLSLAEGFRLRLHTAMCAACRAYETQSAIIDSMLDREPNASSTDHSGTDASELAKKILKNLPK